MSPEPEAQPLESPGTVPDPSAAVPRPGLGDWAYLLIFPLLALLLLWEVLLGGKVLLPAEFLKGMAPWSAAFPANVRETLPQWNVLQWDGMAEFYPWRLHAARSMTAGHIPLWNPHILSGTPFLANSQSAPLYPFHWLYYLPLGASVAVRMGWVDFLHLTLAGCFAYLLARDFRVRPLAAAVSGAAFELCGFAVAWLELPSFIAVSCWIPLLLLCVGRAIRLGCWRWTFGAGASLGLMLLAGHLQVAFYGLLAALCFWLWEAIARPWFPPTASPNTEHRTPNTEHRTPNTQHRTPNTFLKAVAQGLVVLGLGLTLAAPQVLPSMAFSRISHRAGAPSDSGYAGYVERAMPAQHWITLLVPDYYGLPASGELYWGAWEYGPPNVMEYAGHVGLAAFLLVLIGLIWGRKVSRRTWLLVGISVLALLLAAGTPLNRVFYFFVPGFAQSGSPARILVLFCLMQALLAGLGAEWLLRRAEQSWKGILLPLG
ncbi:MAG: hypothetical protein K0Q72_1629, partial [Armatimonadetes bacterium]|nr:hypothetical protein [Armatimonadota bacterium]